VVLKPNANIGAHPWPLPGAMPEIVFSRLSQKYVAHPKNESDFNQIFHNWEAQLDPQNGIKKSVTVVCLSLH
jgi:hypothetical protein